MWSSDVISVEFILGLLMMPKWRRGKGRVIVSDGVYTI